MARPPVASQPHLLALFKRDAGRRRGNQSLERGVVTRLGNALNGSPPLVTESWEVFHSKGQGAVSAATMLTVVIAAGWPALIALLVHWRWPGLLLSQIVCCRPLEGRPSGLHARGKCAGAFSSSLPSRSPFEKLRAARDQAVALTGLHMRCTLVAWPAQNAL